MTKINWKNRWASSAYRQKFIFLIIIAILVIIGMPYGFAFIQNRGGILWNDWLLSILPVIDLSWPIFITMYSLAFLFLIRLINDPHLFFCFLRAYIPITLLRFVLIYFLPLDPPIQMVSLVDPITKIFYGGTEITRDLFFSGHTSTMFLILLILQKRNDKIIATIIVIFIAISLLFQHIHYTIDVFAAFPITYLVWKLTSKFE
jgi:PAP2 superfamily C-terminal